MQPNATLRNALRNAVVVALSLALALTLSIAHALTTESALAIAVGESDDRIKALATAVGKPDPELSRLIDALLNDSVKIAGNKVLIISDGKAIDAISGADTPLPAAVEDVVNNNRMRSEIDGAKASLGLFSNTITQRNNAITELKKISG